MRLKLILLTSLVGAILGAGAPIVMVAITQGSRGFLLAKSYPANDGWASRAIILIPVSATLLAGIFVYRHTARRRKLQAVFTSALVVLLTILGFVAFILAFNIL